MSHMPLEDDRFVLEQAAMRMWLTLRDQLPDDWYARAVLLHHLHTATVAHAIGMPYMQIHVDAETQYDHFIVPLFDELRGMQAVSRSRLLHEFSIKLRERLDTMLIRRPTLPPAP